MDNILACRLCLMMDVRLYSLRSNPLDKYLCCLVGADLHKNELLIYVCGECAVLLKKYYLFRRKCIRGIKTLDNLLLKHIQLSNRVMKSIDRDHCGLASPLRKGAPENQHYYLLSSNSEDENPTSENTIFKVEYVDHGYDRNNQFDDDKGTLVKIEMMQTSVEVDNMEEIATKEEFMDNQNILLPREEIEEILSESGFDTHTHAEAITTKEEFMDKQNLLLPRVEIEETLSESDSDTHIHEKLKAINLKTRKPKKVVSKRPRKLKPDPDSAPKAKRIRESPYKNISQYFDVIERTVEEQRAEILAREHTAKYKKSPLKCTTCFKVFVFNKAYQHHLKKHDPSIGPIECEVCGFRFRHRWELVKHSGIHTHRYACKQCQRVLINRAHAQEHHNWHSGTTYECKYCSEIFSHSTSYLSHMRIKHPSQYICNICGYSFLNNTGLRQHKSGMHKDQTVVEFTGPSCDKCSIQFMDKEAFDRHLVNSSNHIDDPNYNKVCRHCGLTFSETDQLRAHNKTEHPGGRSLKPAPRELKEQILWPKKCDHCDVMIPSAKENWYHHIRDHREKEYHTTAPSPHVCEICGYKSANSGILKYHMRDKHSPERPYACPHCPKAFGTLPKYKMHLSVHSGERPYACAVCDKSFNKKGNLQRHERGHSGLRPHSCKICGKTFATTTARNNHVKYVHYKAPPPVRKRRQGKPVVKETIISQHSI